MHIYNGLLNSESIDEEKVTAHFPVIYEVVRFNSGKPYFFFEHFERLKKSAELLNTPLQLSEKQLLAEIIRMASCISDKEFNIKILIEFANKQNYYVYRVSTIYPSENQYAEGVKCCTLAMERPNPNAKDLQINLGIQNFVKSVKIAKNVFEVLLVNTENLITEGSRSNVLFIKENTLITAPDQMVLEGITRGKVLEIAKDLGAKIEYSEIKLTDLPTYDVAFITGTSAKVLPVSAIDQVEYNVNNTLLRNIMHRYTHLAIESAKNFYIE